MQIKLLIILLFLIVQVNGQYVANWTGWGHNYYEVQQGMDSLNWITIGTVNGQMSLSNYQYTIPATNYYYRIKSGNDSSQAILVSEVLSIKTPPPAHGKNKTKIQTLSVRVMMGSQIRYEIESPDPQQINYSLYDISGRKLREKVVLLHEGTNNIFDSKPVMKGIYYGQFVGYFNSITTKIINQ